MNDIERIGFWSKEESPKRKMSCVEAMAPYEAFFTDFYIKVQIKLAKNDQKKKDGKHT